MRFVRDRVAVVAGATRGAGRSIATALGEAGATVICTGRSSTPGWLRSEMMLDNFGVTEDNWRDALDGSVEGYPPAPGGFDSSESPRYVDRARWNQHSVTSTDLAREYGFTDIDGSRPDSWARHH